MVFEAYTFGIIWPFKLLTSLSMEDEESCTLLLESLYILDQICICTVSMANEWKMLIHYWIFLFPVLISAYALAGKPQFMFMTVGIFLNVYILSNKLLDDFLALLLSVWFAVFSCIFHLLEWSSYFFEGRLWDCSCLKKRLYCVTGTLKWICNGNCGCAVSSWKSVV